MSIVLRIRTQVGTWRLQNVSLNDTIGSLRSRLEVEHKTELNNVLSINPGIIIYY